MTWIIFIVLTIAAFVLGFPAAEYAIHGWHPTNWPADVPVPATWFAAMINSYGLDSFKAYRMLATGETKSFGLSSWPLLVCICAGPLVALGFCFLPQVAVDARSGKPPFRRPRDLILAVFVALALAVVVAKAFNSTPERVVWFDQTIVLNISYPGGHSETLTVPKGVIVAQRGHTTPGFVRLQIWNPAFGYGVADVFEEFIRLHARS